MELQRYKEKGEKIDIEFVAYGAGLNMVRNVANQSKQEKKEISLVLEARIVPTGIGRIVELEEQGWTYVRP